MTGKPVTIIVSDLHLGGGEADSGDDHVYDGRQLKCFIDELATSDEGGKGDIELIINGDFLEFVQVEPEAYSLVSKEFWCSQTESLRKLAAIMTGHREIFAALAEFAKRNVVTIAAGNHDVDLYWPGVRAKLRQEIGPTVSFELGNTWYDRYDGWLRVGHGHMFDPGNQFKNWNDPIRKDAPGGPRLEMCSGTLFMVKFVNWLEAEYPFADNVKPFSALRKILWKENKASYAAIAARFAEFAMRHPGAALGVEPTQDEINERIAKTIAVSDTFSAMIANLYASVSGVAISSNEVRKSLSDATAVGSFVDELVLKVPPQKWMPILDQIKSPSLGIGGSGAALNIAKSGRSDEKDCLRFVAQNELKKKDGPAVIVMGHTHQRDTMEIDHGVYFNPGSWTRYVELEGIDGLTLNDLRDEKRYPYELNYVRIDATSNKEPKAQMICYEKKGGRGVGIAR